MRHIVACQHCRRQYDAEEHPRGWKFRCSCGQVLEVKGKDFYEASVVRCSACGSSREGSESTCRFCSSAFTLFERDRNTVCPGCLARISDRSRFCHHCGLDIHPSGQVGQETSFPCPCCPEGSVLHSRQLPGSAVSLLECSLCAGMWLDHDTVKKVEEQALQRQLSKVVSSAEPRIMEFEDERESPAQGSFYRACIHCKGIMNRVNYGRRSGVIVDICKQHGIWFDDEELNQVLEWIRHGGIEHSRKMEQEKHEESLKLEKETWRLRNERNASRHTPAWTRRGGDVNMVDFAIGLLGWG